MKVILYLSSKKREQTFHKALASGFRRHGDQVEYVPRKDYMEHGPVPGMDVAVIVGVKSRAIYTDCVRRGITTLLIDKGYFRNREYYRFSLGGYQPPYLEAIQDLSMGNRMAKMGVRLRSRHTNGNTIIYAGSSHKYCAFHGLGNVNDYARLICASLVGAAQGEKQVIYRPKPSWWAKDTESEKRIAPDMNNLPKNTKFSGPNELLSQLLPDCYCLVTHGSTAALDALAFGVPVVLLSPEGISPAWSLSEHSVENVIKPYWPSDEQRHKIFANLAWCQFNVDEMADGTAWANLKPWWKYARSSIPAAESQAADVG